MRPLVAHFYIILTQFYLQNPNLKNHRLLSHGFLEESLIFVLLIGLLSIKLYLAYLNQKKYFQCVLPCFQDCLYLMSFRWRHIYGPASVSGAILIFKLFLQKVEVCHRQCTNRNIGDCCHQKDLVSLNGSTI